MQLTRSSFRAAVTEPLQSLITVMLPSTKPLSTPSRVDIFAVHADHAAREWDAYRPWVERALDRTTQADSDDVFSRILEGVYTLWEVESDGHMTGIVITRLIIFPKKRMLCIYAIAGFGIDEVVDESLKFFQQVAREQVCDGIIAYCRPGLVPMLKMAGFKPTSTVMELML